MMPPGRGQFGPQGHGWQDLWRGLQGFPGLRIESLWLPKYCLGLSSNNLVSPTGLSKIVMEIL